MACPHAAMRGSPTLTVRLRTLHLTTADKSTFWTAKTKTPFPHSTSKLRWVETLCVRSPKPIREAALIELLNATPRLTHLEFSARNLGYNFFYATLFQKAVPTTWAQLRVLQLYAAPIPVPVSILLKTLPLLQTLELCALSIGHPRRGSGGGIQFIEHLVLRDVQPRTAVSQLLQHVVLPTVSITSNVVHTQMIYDFEGLTPFGATLQRLHSVDLSGSSISKLPQFLAAKTIILSNLNHAYSHKVLHQAINPDTLNVWQSNQTWTTLDLLRTLERCTKLQSATVTAQFIDCLPVHCIGRMPNYTYKIVSTTSPPAVCWTRTPNTQKLTV